MGRVIKANPVTLHVVPYAVRKPPEPQDDTTLLTAIVLVVVGAVLCWGLM